ncbi:hypothetical protein BH23PLA1_BH23PLA1_36400 [soil metagenome]
MRDRPIRLSFLALILGLPAAIVALSPDDGAVWSFSARFAAMAWAEAIVLAGLIFAAHWRGLIPQAVRVAHRSGRNGR